MKLNATAVAPQFSESWSRREKKLRSHHLFVFHSRTLCRVSAAPSSFAPFGKTLIRFNDNSLQFASATYEEYRSWNI